MRCIECEEIELARVRDRRPGQTLPIPYQALDGFPAGRSPAHLTRRRLLQWGAAGVASVYAAKELGWEQVWASVAAAADAEEKKCVVLLYLAGGNDGLNVVLPSDGPDYIAYRDARPNIHRVQGANAGGRMGSMQLPGPGSALALSNAVVSGTDNNGGTIGFDTLYGTGTGGPGSDLAIMPAVDAKKYSLSHFDNSDLWFEASSDINNKTGWLGRWIDRNGSPDNPLQAVSIDTALSKSIRTVSKPVCAISSLPMSGFKVSSNVPPSGSPATPDWNEEVRKLSLVGAGPDNAYLARSRSSYNLTYATAQQAGATPTLTTNLYPNANTLSKRLQTAAYLIDKLGTQIVTIHWGGFDTHTGQIASQDRQLKELSRALAAFQADLKGA
jgi:uncharacterized protein (DUF1501 family)